MTIRVIGVDCATIDKKIGLALGEFTDGAVRVTDLRHGSVEEKAVDVISRWLLESPREPTLIAIDAPLGWPMGMSEALPPHLAGQSIAVEPDMMFRRETDRFVISKLEKMPLEVGADRIARTAHSALRMLADLRLKVGASIPLAWSCDLRGLAAIEVYPAATLLTRGLRASGYKKRAQTAERDQLAREIQAHVSLPGDHRLMIESADALDAVVCVLAGADFLRGDGHPPISKTAAEKEGWIWFRSGPRGG